MAAEFYLWEANETLVLHVYLQPAASQDKIVGLHGNALKIRVTAAPVAGQANKYLLKFLARLFSVPVRQVTLQKGQGSRIKTIRISQPATLPDFIAPGKSVS